VTGRMREFTTMDLFAGCGGLTCGFASADHPAARFVPVSAVEMDRDAAATYATNFGGHVFVGDIARWLQQEQLPSADVVVGGPPCQGFSALGKQDPSDPRNLLWSRYVDAVARVAPLYFVIENVPEFLRSSQFQDLVAETGPDGRLHDYQLEARVLLASDHGAAQNRRRAIVVGRRAGLPEVGEPSRTPSRRTVRDALRYVRRFVPEWRTELPDRWRRFDGTDVPGPFTMRELHVTRSFTEVSRRRFALIPLDGGSRSDLPEELQAPCWIRHTTGARDVMGRLRWDTPSVTIRTEFFKPEKGRYLHPSEPRPITHLEAALIQGFPRHFRWCGTKTSIARQIGNAVPVPLARSIAESLLQALATGIDGSRSTEEAA
jgi:DNA (cytosine-5)-methyltransferase 1